MNAAIETARKSGIAFANELNAAPQEAQNWTALTESDELPPEDYATMAREFGDVTLEMERSYRAGFNSVFVSVNDPS